MPTLLCSTFKERQHADALTLNRHNEGQKQRHAKTKRNERQTWGKKTREYLKKNLFFFCLNSCNRNPCWRVRFV